MTRLKTALLAVVITLCSLPAFAGGGGFPILQRPTPVVVQPGTTLWPMDLLGQQFQQCRITINGVSTCTSITINTGSVLKLPNGSASAPSLTFASDTDNGAYYISANKWGLAANGALQLQIEDGAVRLGSTSTFLDLGNNATVLRSDGANIATMRNGTNAQQWRVANTFTSATNQEYAGIDWQTIANTAIIGTRTAATGTSRITLFTSQGDSGTAAMSGMGTKRGATAAFGGAGINSFVALGLFDTTGTNTQSTGSNDAIVTLGLATRTATTGSTYGAAILPTYNQAAATTSNTDLLINRTETSVGSGAQLLFDAQVGSVSKASITNAGFLTLASSALFSGGNLQLACNSSSCPMLKRSGTNIQVRLADDSAMASVVAANVNIQGQLQMGTGSMLLVSPTAPTISSGFGTSPSIVNNNGTAAFTINVGTGGVATSGVIGLPTASNGWNCFATDRTSNIVTRETATTTTTVTLTAASAWGASDILQVSCFAY